MNSKRWLGWGDSAWTYTVKRRGQAREEGVGQGVQQGNQWMATMTNATDDPDAVVCDSLG